MTIEHERLEASRDRTEHWKRWGPYLAERAWGTVREDYSPYGTAWDYLPHDHARSRAYRWNEDGIAGICDRHQKICFSIALWNGQDPILKERLFGLTGSEGNHGEDVKECYFYLDSTPTHSYMKYLYKYPQTAFPYTRLVEENRRRDRNARELELAETGVFADNRYFDVFVEYAKASVEEILVRVTLANRGPVAATLHLLPTVWFRNTWSWGYGVEKPSLKRCGSGAAVIELSEPDLGHRWMIFEGSPDLLFCGNDTNTERLYGSGDPHGYPKDGIGDFLIHGRSDAIDPSQAGTKASGHYQADLGPGESRIFYMRLTHQRAAPVMEEKDYARVFTQRIQEADEFYATVIPAERSDDARNVMRQAFAGMMWSKQYYHYVVREWMAGDPAGPPPTPGRTRNSDWGHLFCADVLSMPDKWEYPWFAAWDLAFHCIPIALIDSEFAKEQLMLMVREWYMHPNGQLPAYEWAFGDVNPPVHAWAALRIYKIEKKRRGVGDRTFLQRIFHKLLLNFTWWVNRKDAEGRNIFQGGFLGLDNIGVFDRSAPLPTEGHIEQADGTGWMAMYCLNLLAIAMELASEDAAYEDVASKFWEHFLNIAAAMTNVGSDGISLWNEQDGFFYDVLHIEGREHFPLRLKSIVGLIPLYAVETLDSDLIDRLPGFKRRMQWFIDNRPDLTKNVASMQVCGQQERRLLAIMDETQLRRILSVLLDENEFLSTYGIRALSRQYREHPYVLPVNGEHFTVEYQPAESSNGLFGGNSNWRGPVWFPVNYLLIESLQKFHHYYGEKFRVECPTRSGRLLTLWEVAEELSRRLTRIFLRGDEGARPVHGSDPLYRDDLHWNQLVLFYEYFHGDNGSGVGASHQTGWTGLVAKLLQQSGEPEF